MTDTGPVEPIPVPPGVILVPDEDLRTADDGRLLIGGSPFAITRLTSQGAELAHRWFGGLPVAESATQQLLARRLIAAGMAHPRWGGSDPTPGRNASITIVIPVKDDMNGLNETLAGLVGDAAVERSARIVIVDDGSSVPVDLDHPDLVDTAIEAHIDNSGSIEVLRRQRSGGPGAARQDGLALVETDFVAFVDAGVTVVQSAIAGLLDEFQDPDVVAAAPRIVPTASPGLVGRYEQQRSPLDLGSIPSPVGPGRRVAYVPTACLMARTEAVRSIGGFDAALRYGEDVDLVWRLGRIGSIRYRGDLRAGHPPRSSLAAFINQRRGYGSAAGPLAARHGEAVAPARTSLLGAAPLALLAVGRPLAAIMALIGATVALRRRMGPIPDETAEAVVLTGRGQWHGAVGLATAAVRAWLPLLAILALVMPRQRWRLASIAAVGFGRRLIDGPRAPGDALVDLGLGAVDDASYCVGLWQGAWTERSARSLQPVVSSPSVASTRR